MTRRGFFRMLAGGAAALGLGRMLPADSPAVALRASMDATRTAAHTAVLSRTFTWNVRNTVLYAKTFNAEFDTWMTDAATR